MHYHVVARTFGESTPFSNPNQAYWVWHRLKEAFPQTLAATLMPNHLHLVLKSDSPYETRISLAHILGRFTHVFQKPTPFWQPVPQPSEIVSQEKLRRDIRYVLLNPCRAKLCKDPLEWKWSTYRGSLGASAHPWVPQKNLISVMNGSLPQIHRYITSDPSVSVSGTSLPQPAPTHSSAQRSLKEIAWAAFAATEELPDLQNLQIKKSNARRYFVRLACQQGWTDVGMLTRFMQIHRATTWALIQREKGKSCAPATLCLGDPRLLNLH